jgi:hypothetical protein
MKIIYWNSKQHADFSTIKDILLDEVPDILFLSETNEATITSNLAELNISNYEHFDNPGCSRIIILRKSERKLSISRQDYYYSAVKDISSGVIIISVHLPSQMYQSMDGLKSYIRSFRDEIDVEFGNSSSKDILVIGDFNINPFEKPMIDFDGFSASNSRKLRRSATHLKSTRELYYNPTWTLYGKNNFPGTKYFKRPSGSAFDILEHHFLDQVLVSFSLSQKIVSECVKVLEVTTNKMFFDIPSNSVLLSDHLPLIYEYEI